MDKLRAFIAFEIPEPLREALSQTQNRLGKDLPHLRPIRPRGIHLTLSFLGEISQAQVYKVGEVMDKVCKNHRLFHLDCKKVGGFPDAKNPRVIWAGIEGQLKALLALQKELTEQLKAAGFNDENREYSPHLTLFRLKTQKQLGLLRKKMEKEASQDFGRFRCDALILFKSELMPEGAVYTKLKIAGLD